ncbi:hypothetical protein A3Q56_03695 [Intoshia linei]|uniref:HAT C-terminal dimerisation domain-containing protein n=1 Tax=Intoshia linei TaxID=1819745 RepID=A0A177B2U3_9BILA|nr:hypothetical protein A3Q56_03695 [Intoshia linei]
MFKNINFDNDQIGEVNVDFYFFLRDYMTEENSELNNCVNTLNQGCTTCGRTAKLEFEDRFGELKTMKNILQLGSPPFMCDINSTLLEFQMELLEIKNDELIKNKFNENIDLVEIWKYAFAYPSLCELARNTLVAFGSTYLYESGPDWIMSPFDVNVEDVEIELREEFIDMQFDLVAKTKFKYTTLSNY